MDRVVPPIRTVRGSHRRAGSFATYHGWVARYRVSQRTTGRLLLDTDDQFAGFAALRAGQAAGIAWDDLDMIDTQTGRSLVQRGHESGLRSMMAESSGSEYRSFRSLAEAQAAPSGVVILEGDYGGQIFVTCPARLVRCTEDRLRRLAEEVQALTWSRDPGAATVLFEPLAPGASVAGGMDGGLVTDAAWLHEELHQLGLRAAIEGVLSAASDVLGEPQPLVPDEVRAAILRAYHERVDVYCHVFGFPSPGYLYDLDFDEWRRREDAAVLPPAGYSRWYSSTLRAVVEQAGLPVRRAG
jgi:hypothetical protein